MDSIVDMAYAMLVSLKDLDSYTIGKFLTGNAKLRNFRFNELFSQNKNLEKTVKNIAINIILMEYERTTHSPSIKSFMQENDLVRCMEEFYINDEFRNNAINKYYKVCDDDYAPEDVSSKYQILLKFKSKL